jgi:glycosyltransferase involved in cell wall biosynthesis
VLPIFADAYHVFWAVTFWLCAGLLVYVYLGYPGLAWARASLARRPPPCDGPLPVVSVIVVAHDEADRIAARIDNLLAQDYPRDRLEILIASDGSGDGTASLARTYARAGVAVHAFAVRRGKAAVLNDLVRASTAEVLVFTDANTRFEPGAVRALLEAVAAPGVGAACGRLVFEAPVGGRATPEAAYWDRETRLKEAEGALGALACLTLAPDCDCYALLCSPKMHAIKTTYAPKFNAAALAGAPTLTINTVLGVLRACQRGIGVALLPDYLVEENGGLVQLFGESDTIALDAYFVYPEELKSVARVQVFRDFLVSKAQRWHF